MPALICSAGAMNPLYATFESGGGGRAAASAPLARCKDCQWFHPREVGEECFIVRTLSESRTSFVKPDNIKKIEKGQLGEGA